MKLGAEMTFKSEDLVELSPAVEERILQMSVIEQQQVIAQITEIIANFVRASLPENDWILAEPFVIEKLGGMLRKNSSWPVKANLSNGYIVKISRRNFAPVFLVEALYRQASGPNVSYMPPPPW